MVRGSITASVEWTATYSDAEIYNVVLAKYESGETSLFSTATNANGANGTSTVQIGTRTSAVLTTSLADTQDKLDMWAQDRLAELSRRTKTATCRIGALDSAGVLTEIESGRLLSITDPADESTGIYQVIKCDLEETENTIDWIMEVVML